MNLLFQPEFYDFFGVGVFLFLTILSLWCLNTRRPVPRWALVAILIIGLAGLLVDGAVVFFTFLY